MLATQYVPASRLTRWLAPWLTSATLRRIARALLTVYQRSGLQALVATSGLLRRKGIGRWASLVPTRTAANNIGDWRGPRRQQRVQETGRATRRERGCQYG